MKTFYFLFFLFRFIFPFPTRVRLSCSGVSSVSRGGGCNSRPLLLRSLFLFALSIRSFFSLFLFALSFPFHRVSWTPTFCRNLSRFRFAAAFAESHSFVRSCVLSSKVSNILSLRMLCLAQPLALILTSLVRSFLCALVEAYNTTPVSIRSFA